MNKITAQYTDMSNRITDGEPSSRPALGPTQLPTQWVLGVSSPAVKRPGREADHPPPSSAEVNNGGPIPPLLHMYS
jgi:hypothetical protein